MGSGRKNSFKNAVRHLKSCQIDEKLELLNELPTNNTSGIYIVDPESQETVGENTYAPLDLTQDDLPNGRDTTGLFGEDGSILTIEPPGNTSYVLGPMMSMWYSWGNFSTIGYVRQSDRRMVDLGRINGRISTWNGTNGFTSYGQLTLAQAQWYRDQYNSGNTQQYRAFYPGPPSNPADQFGRYLGDIINLAKEISREVINRIPPVLGPFDPNIVPGLANPQRTVVKGKKKGGLGVKTVYHGTSKSAEQGIRNSGFRGTKTGLVPNKVWVGDKDVAQKYAQGGYSSGSMQRNAPDQQSTIKLRIPKGSGVSVPGPFGRETAISTKTANVGAGLKPQRTSSGVKAGTTIKVTGVSRGGGSGGVVQPVEPWIGKTDPLQGYTWDNKSGKYRLANSYNQDGLLLSESKKSILKNIKKPYVLPEQPKVKYKVKPGANKTVNADLMKKAEVPSSFKKAEERTWGKYEKEQNARFSQERKNEVLDHLGGGDHAWEYMTETSRKKNDEIMYGNFGGEQKKRKVVRKEQLKADTLLFIVDENGKKESILQSELSIRFADEFNKELFEKYFEEQETLQSDKDPLFKKVSKRLRKEIDYSDKPSKNGYPNDPPPEMVNGWHPEYGKDKGYYNKLDPQSAQAMPKTGNSHIDAKVQSAKKVNVKESKKYNWRDELNESMTSSGMFFTTLPATGDVDLSSIEVSNASSYSDTSYANVGSDSFFSQYGGLGDALTISSYGVYPYAVFNAMDTTAVDTISFTGIAGDLENGSFPTNSDLLILWYNYDTEEFGEFVGIPKTATSLANYNITLPPGARGSNVEFVAFQERSSENAGQDLVGYYIPIGNEYAEITTDNDGLIVSLLINYPLGTETPLSLGRSIMNNFSKNSSVVNGTTIKNTNYPGYAGPVSGNAGNPNIDGFNGDLQTLKSNDSAAFTSGYLSGKTQQQLIDMFADTNMNAAALYIELGEYNTASNLANNYYAQYVYNQDSGNTSLANYYLNLSNQQITVRNTKDTQIRSRVNSASALPDSRWTNADYEKVADDIYNLYKGAASYAITNFSTKRRTPMNVFVPLDSPQATSFIRADPNLSNLSPEERNKKLREMLSASDEYVEKMLGIDFPGTGAVAPGEYDPFAQAPAGAAGDTPGVEVAGLPSGMYPFNPLGGQAPAPQGYKEPGTYDPNQFYNLSPGSLPSPNIPRTPPGLSQSGTQDTQIAQQWTDDPSTWPSIKNPVKTQPAIIDPKTGWPSVPKVPPSYRGKPGGQQVRMAHYEPQGELISERKKLKSPEEVLNKIPGYYTGKPAPLGFPVEPPAKMVNGMHSDLVDGKKVADRFNRMDPQSAQAMPKTGNSHIDKKVEKAKKQPK